MKDAASTDSQSTSRPPRSEALPATNEIDEIAPGVLRSQLPVELPGLGNVNMYILEDENGIAVVDPGLPGDRAYSSVVDRLKRADHQVNDVHTIIVTHSHYDHYGGAIRLREETGASIVGHRNLRNWADRRNRTIEDVNDFVEFMDLDEAAALERQRRSNESDYGNWTPWGTWSEPPAAVIRHLQELGLGNSLFSAPTPDRGLSDGSVLMLAGRPWVAVHTPGHTADHLCLYDETEGLMITGDHVLPTITPHISGYSHEDRPLGCFFDSLNRMHDFSDVRMALPAHGSPFTDLYGRADAICDHHHERLDEFRTARDELGEAPVEEYMKLAFKERSWGEMAASETFAHLDHLRDSGELTGRWVKGLLHFG